MNAPETQLWSHLIRTMTKLFARRAQVVPQSASAGNELAGDGADTYVLTSAGQRIPARSNILASMSPVLERKLNSRKNHGRSEKVIRILGAPNDAVLAFVALLHAGSDKEGEEIMRKNGMHLLVLSHVYQVKWLKRACEKWLASWLNVEVVVDVLKLARLCDADWLAFHCFKLIHKDYTTVQTSDAWLFLQNNDPWLELSILQFLHDSDTREKEIRRNKEEQKTYQQLSEAMICLEHIFKEGCTDIKPDRRQKSCCPSSSSCQPLQLLLHHFSKCNGDRSTCSRCRRIWELLKLHSAVCMAQDSTDCKVPLCRQFRYRFQKLEGKLEERKWMILGKKLASNMAFSSLAKRKMPECGLGLGLG
ncbi:BTB/POZ and TAZ domain-containing protein 1-like [Phalaenopsis equestris]|uniref:BTB/POZ and TAZ domain-containing protein 1-like n=1 Tax=Phalaenopsis equestris TaxID=78828 RepID=UPI0009E3EC18|nr:BTB/POZ and TAZ domain-containing protein 1-like [Phalaenopsis equestris]